MNYSSRKKNKTVKYIILHYTGMKNLQSAYGRLISPLSDVSAHYLVSKEGKIYNLLCPRFKAWHAGKSQWIHTYIHAQIHTYMHTYKHAHTQYLLCCRTHACMHTHIHAYIHACMHACIPVRRERSRHPRSESP